MVSARWQASDDPKERSEPARKLREITFPERRLHVWAIRIPDMIAKIAKGTNAIYSYVIR